MKPTITEKEICALEKMKKEIEWSINYHKRKLQEEETKLTALIKSQQE